ncbi:MAG: restriction endonuclease [Chloroflexota bacterium]
MTQRRRTAQGPQFIQYFGPVITALQSLGGSGRPDEVVEQITTSRPTTEEENEQLSDGTTRIEKNIHWARFYLAKTGYIDGSTRGVWLLTEKGRNTQTLSTQQTFEIFREVQQLVKQDVSEDTSQIISKEENAITYDSELVNKHRIGALNLLNNMPPSGFERFCQLLLRYAGFADVTVTGRSGDGGIDGVGTLVINPLMSFKVAFQCKRYSSSSVGAREIRDFRGSISGRVDKGIFLTTSTFTRDAKKEAGRDGATPPMELVDSDKMLDLMEQLEVGLKKELITTYNVRQDFFEQFYQ